MNSFKIIGTSPTRVDALEKVTGKAMFTADFMSPPMLHLKAVRSPHAHARILHIDTSEAERLPGVKGIVRPEDAPDKRSGVCIQDRYILPRDYVVRYVGQAILLIAANTADIAETAVELVKIEYEELPAVFDPEEAIKKDPPCIIHPDCANYHYDPLPRYPQILDPDIPNLQTMALLRTGDVEKGFREADLIVENRYYCEPPQHCPLETHVIDAWVELDGTLTIRSSRQGLFLLRAEAARFFDLPETKVRVIGPYCGGAFGSKMSRFQEKPIALAAMKIGKPVRMEYTRAEDLANGGRRPAVVAYLKNGVKKDGTILALEARLIIDGGAFGAEQMAFIPRTAISSLCATYRIPNAKIDSLGVYTNLPPGTTMRGVETPEMLWATEQQMEIIAEKLGMDSINLREKNILNEGEVNAMGEMIESIGVRGCMKKALEWIKWEEPPKPEGCWVKGKGIAIGGELIGRGYTATSQVKVRSDGHIDAYYGAAEMGQGASTMVAQIAAEEFGVPMDKVHLHRGDTAFTPFDWGNYASRTTTSTGNAVKRACQDAKAQLFRLASPKMDTPPELLDMSEGKIFCKPYPSKSIPIQDLFSPLGFVKEIGEIVGRGECTFPAPPIKDLKTGHFEKFADYSYGAFAVEVAVNLETGEIRISRVANALDMGQPINPKMCEQQIESGMGMGIGTALYEALTFDDKGRLLNPDLVNYKIPTFAEIPSRDNIASIIAPTPLKEGPYGAKGFGEMVMATAAAAIGNGVYDALGVRIYDLPLTRERVLSAIKTRAKEEKG